MKKVININFQGRVVPIEETAYDILKQYVESLRDFFENEEGRDEIINDIEGRIAELFSESLKKGSTCISDDDVNHIINSMGRPEDFEDDETKVQSQLSNGGHQKKQSSGGEYQHTETTTRGRLYRDERDHYLGGVCAGLANYLRMDPSIIRILFAVITFGGFGAGVLIYILMWIILPSKPLETQVRKRLYRNPDDKVVAGVASGIAAYFNIAVWIPRIIFALPLILGIISSIFQNVFFHFDPFPSIIFGSFGSSLFVIYIVLWAVIPRANSASEKLEMRGEKVDLNTIKNTIQEDMGSFKGRAERFSEEFKETVKQKASSFTAEATPIVRKTGSRLGNAIGILFKGFFLLIAGVIAFALLMAMLGVMIGGVSVFPLKNFFLDGFWQNFLAWATLILFLAVPVIAFVTWLIRRLIGVKSKNPYLGYIFGGFWFIGLISAIILVASIASNYRTRAGIPEKVDIAQPQNSKLLVKTSRNLLVNYYGGDWYGIHWDHGDAPFFGLTEDSFMMRTVQVRVVKSEDSVYHLNIVKFSRGSAPEVAKEAAKKISFSVSQNDSILTLPQGFTLTRDQKFRNQQVLLIIEVPLGKKIQMDRTVGEYKWFNVEMGNDYNGGWASDWDDNWQSGYNWDTNKEYIMTEKGLKPTHPADEDRVEDNDNPDDAKQQLDEIQRKKQELEQKEQDIKNSMKQDSAKYHYQQPADSSLKAPAKPAAKEAQLKVQAERNTETYASPSSLAQRFTL